MNFKTVITYTTAIASAIAILTFSSEARRQQEIAAAKRRIAESKAQMARAKAEIEQELQELKHQIQTEQDIQPATQLPDPWTTETATELSIPSTASATPQQHRWQLALPPARNLEAPKKARKSQPVKNTAPQPKQDYAKFSIRELKAIASTRKLKGYGSLKKAELVARLIQMDVA